MIRKSLIAILCSLAILACMTPPAYAVEYHEDPDTAKQIYSGISLLLYYSDCLDPILQRNPEATETGLSKMPFANIPPDLEKPTNDFATFGVTFSHSLVDLFEIWQRENLLMQQYRLDDADKLGKQIADELPQSRNQLAELKASIEATGTYLKVDTAPSQSQLKITYNSVMDKINQLEKMLDLLSRPLLNGASLLNKLNPDLLRQILKPTSLTLEINPQIAFVGDEVNFQGVLSSQGEVLGGRDIDILLNSSQYLTVSTDSDGRYQGKLQIPYRYGPELEVQVIYYPQDEDVGHYLGSSSPVIKMTIQYYEAKLVIQVNGPAYPGREAKITGNFDYGQAVPIDRTKTELYLDDSLLTQFTAREAFTQNVVLNPGMGLGKHTVNVFVPAEGRYAPVNASCIMEVIKAATILDINTSRIATIPGNLGLNGKLHSELSPLKEASINIQMNKTGVQFKSLPDGSFNMKIKTAMGLSLLGSQMITIQIQPQEPWNAPLVVTRNVFMINVVSCGIILVVLLILVLYLPRRFRKWLRVYSGKINRPAEVVLTAPAAPVYEEKITAATPFEGDLGDSEPSSSILNWYRLVLKLVQTITRAILKPQQTLREYARENSPELGPLGKYFIEFTFLIEKLLYSTYKPSGEDIKRSQQLSQSIRREAKSENV